MPYTLNGLGALSAPFVPDAYAPPVVVPSLYAACIYGGPTPFCMIDGRPIMARHLVQPETFQQGSSKTIQRRLSHLPSSPYAEGAPFVPADVASIALTVYSAGDVVSGFNAVAVSPSDVLSGILHGWKWDTTGYNLASTLPAAFPAGGVLAKCEYTLTMADGTVWTLIFQGPVESVP